MLIENPRLEEELKEQRKAWALTITTKFWEGVYFMAPPADNDHQKLVAGLTFASMTSSMRLAWGRSSPGSIWPAPVKIGRTIIRAPDVVIILASGTAQDQKTCYRGAADFVVEITSPRDRTYEKIPFYGRQGVRELLIVDRQSWTLELYRNQGNGLEKAGQSETQRGDVLSSGVVPLEFRLLPGQPRPRIEVTHVETRRQWMV